MVWNGKSWSIKINFWILKNYSKEVEFFFFQQIRINFCSFFVSSSSFLFYFIFFGITTITICSHHCHTTHTTTSPLPPLSSLNHIPNNSHFRHHQHIMPPPHHYRCHNHHPILWNINKFFCASNNWKIFFKNFQNCNQMFFFFFFLTRFSHKNFPLN